MSRPRGAPEPTKSCPYATCDGLERGGGPLTTIRNAFRVLLVLWAGSLWSLAWVTQTLFGAQSDRHLAGVLTGRLFTIETYLGIAVALIALLLPGRSKFLKGY